VKDKSFILLWKGRGIYMSINPIDIMRTQEAAQIKHIEIQRNQSAQEQVGRDFQNMVIQEQSKTTQTTKSDNNEYRYDAKEKGNNEYKGSGRKNGKKEEKKETKEPKKNGGIDILI
jgi:hypothetical protein